MRISDWSSDVCSSDLQLVHAWDVLATMTPPEYSALRPYLAQSSGFQSYQYRQIEFALGNKNAGMLKPHAHRPDILAVVANALETPSLYDRSEEHTSELQSLMRISYAVFCLKKKNTTKRYTNV